MEPKMFSFATIPNDISFNSVRLREPKFSNNKHLFLVHSSLNIIKLEKCGYEFYANGIEDTVIEWNQRKHIEEAEILKNELFSFLYLEDYNKKAELPLFETYDEAVYARKLIISRNIEHLEKQLYYIEENFKRINEGKINISTNMTTGEFKLRASVNVIGHSDKLPLDVELYIQERMSKYCSEIKDDLTKKLDYFKNFKPIDVKSLSTE